jgi:hydrogenase expression/formation protein HypC
MCIAIPSRVVEIRGSTATVERFGERLEVSLMMLAEPVEPGDFLIVQARSWAVEKLGAEDAERALELFRECFSLLEAEP